MTWLIVLLALVVALAGAAGAIARLRSASLKQRFGLDITEPAPDVSARHVEEWSAIQARFVDDPRHTLAEAAELLTRVMNERGYPVEELDDYSKYVSVDRPEFVAGYRMAEAVRIGAETATIDDQRQAFQHYHSLFDELLNSRAASADDAAQPGAERAEHDVS